MGGKEIARALREDPAAYSNVVAHQLAVLLEMGGPPERVLLEGVLAFCRREATYQEALEMATKWSTRPLPISIAADGPTPP